MKFNGVMIGSEDPHALGAFYTSVLGEPGFHDGSWYGWDDMSLMIGAHSDVHGRNTTPQRIMLMIEVTDMDESFATLVGLGAKVIAEPYKPDGDGDFQLATFEDRALRTPVPEQRAVLADMHAPLTATTCGGAPPRRGVIAID